MTYEEQIATIGSLGVKYEKEIGEATTSIRSSLRLLAKLRDGGVPLEDPEKVIAAFAHLAPKTANGKWTNYQGFVDLYFKFVKEYVGVSPRMNDRQGKAMNDIITYLVKESKKGDEAGALLAWEFILTNWTKLTDYIRNQTTLALIDKNLQEILTQLRNGSNQQQATQSTSRKVRANIKRTK